jgi:predicted DCC family thiol-disulfide oxidoreductase YuxK
MNTSQQDKITVYYDGACPSCIRDRDRYERLCGERGKYLDWFDITGKDEELCRIGIDPKLALTELHIQTADGQIISEINAYIILLQRTFWLKPFALILKLPFIKLLLARFYHQSVNRRLRRSGRL